MERRILCLLGLAVCAMMVATCMASKGDAEWKAFKTKKGKKYKDDKEEGERKEKFLKNLEKVEKQNKDHDEGKSGWKAALNDCADMSEEEFLATKTGGFKLPTEEEQKGYNKIPPVDNVKRLVLPNSLDYRDNNLVTKVRNQGNCGSSYAFSSVGSLEALHKKQFDNLEELSEQWIVDCAQTYGTYGTYGCNGGWMANVFLEVDKEGGIPILSDYAYTGQEATCQDKVVEYWWATIDIAYIGEAIGYDEYSIQWYLVDGGIPLPASICMNAAAMLYDSGVYSSNCCGCAANHAVLIVGYGVSASNEKYWILKNSFGSDWGENGYMLMKRDVGMCDFGSYFAIVYRLTPPWA